MDSESLMVAIRKDLTVDNGATFTLSVRYLDSTGVPVDLSGYAAEFVLHTERGIEIHTLDADCTSLGWINVVGTDETTSLWPYGKQAYHLDLINADGDVDRLFFGAVNVRFTGLAPVV
jgi:hypothetical protein